MYKSLVIKSAHLLLVVFVISSGSMAFAKSGTPLRIRCELTTLAYDSSLTDKEVSDIVESKEDLDNLTFSQEVVTQSNKVFECRQYENKPILCVGEFATNGNLQFRYHSNTQNGGVEITDPISGLSFYSHWLNQYDVTKSGYLHLNVELTYRKGGLVGNPRAFRITGGCYASQKDFQ